MVVLFLLLLVAILFAAIVLLTPVAIIAALLRRRALAVAILRGLIVLGASAALALGAIFVYGRIQGRRIVTLPRPTGSYAVGRKMMDWIDPTRIDPFASRRDEHRHLSVWLWYPAQTGPVASAAPYRPGIADETPGFIETRPASVRTHSVDDAPISDRRPIYPVVVFEPGLGADAFTYTSLAEEFASHGYIVAAINPTYSTTVRFADGTVVPSIRRARDDADPGQIVDLWADDMRFVTTRLGELNGSATPFNGRLDLSRIGYVGHSLGGAAATEAGRRESRCAAVACVDGSPYGDVVSLGLQRPFLFLGHDGAFSDVPDLAAKLARLTRTVPAGGAVVATIRGTRHFNFTDRSIMSRTHPLARLLGFLGPIDGYRGLSLTRAILIRFFDAFLSDGPAFSLTDIAREHPEVIIRICPHQPGEPYKEIGFGM